MTQINFKIITASLLTFCPSGSTLCCKPFAAVESMLAIGKVGFCMIVEPSSANAIIMVFDTCFMVECYHELIYWPLAAAVVGSHYTYTTNLMPKCCQFVLGRFSEALSGEGSHFWDSFLSIGEAFEGIH